MKHGEHSASKQPGLIAVDLLARMRYDSARKWNPKQKPLTKSLAGAYTWE